MKATREMEDAFFEALLVGEAVITSDIQRAIQAVLDLIDPVPTDVDVITDAGGDEWNRVRDSEVAWLMVGTVRVLPVFDIIKQYGPITWRGRCNNCDPLEAGASATRTDVTEGDEACRDCNRKVKV